MNVIEKNVGPKIDYEVRGQKITFDDDLTINLAKRQKDDPEHIDVCFARDGELVSGAAAGRAYVAESTSRRASTSTTRTPKGTRKPSLLLRCPWIWTKSRSRCGRSNKEGTSCPQTSIFPIWPFRPCARATRSSMMTRGCPPSW